MHMLIHIEIIHGFINAIHDKIRNVKTINIKFESGKNNAHELMTFVELNFILYNIRSFITSEKTP